MTAWTPNSATGSNLSCRVLKSTPPAKQAMSVQTYIVPEGIRSLRADKALALAFPEHSRTALQRAFDAGRVLLRGAAIKRDHAVAGGDVVEFSFPDVAPAEL